jgi:SAM-dependent methyltransferase
LNVIDLYERHARAFDRTRGRSRQERVWLDRFLSYVPGGGTVLDVGCGSGEPIARYLLDHGVGVVGVDGATAMIDLCRARFPDSEWLVGDMRELDLERHFDGILAWDSFFHLGIDDQRETLPRLAMHARPGAPLMFTSGTEEGEAIGSCFGESLYHASLDSEEYRRLLRANGFVVRDHIAQDVECGDHTVWLATCDLRGRAGDFVYLPL